MNDEAKENGTVTCKRCGGVKEIEYAFADQSLSAECAGFSIHVSGNLPDGVSLSVREVSNEKAQREAEENGLDVAVLKSFDIKQDIINIFSVSRDYNK